ncbi:MAG: hypothetical protein DRJ50_10715 [Actinobacteria bacterium]|nr:MAG: hypothetical protein DRJ50_10715 [Actinomycetota bacterium]
MASSWNNKKLVERLIEEGEKAIAVSFGEVVLSLQAERTLAALAELISNGQFEEALSMVTAGAGKLATTINQVFVGAGIETLQELGDKFGVIISYDQANWRAVRIMTDNKLNLVREFALTQKEATRQALVNGIRDGLNPRAQARAFRESIGLTKAQVEYVDRYRKELDTLNPRALGRKLRDGRFDRTIEKAIRDKSPLGKKQIEKMVGRYRERWIKHRSEVIARTESLRSVHQGTNEAVQQALESGAIDADKTKQTWNTALDERVRDFATGATTSHATMHHQERPVGVPFESGASNQLMFPGDPAAPAKETIMCRCRVSTRVEL